MDSSGTNQKYEAVRERLFAPHTEFSYTNLNFMANLMSEFLIRMATWHAALGLAPEYSPDIWPFGNIFAHIAPEFTNDSEIEDAANLWKQQGRRPAEVTLTRSMLYWAKYQTRLPLLQNLPLDDPYEPALMFFEIGGYFWTEHGFICVDGISLTKRTSLHWLPKKAQT